MGLLRVLKNAVRRFFIFLLRRPILWFANRFTSFPKQDKVNEALTELYGSITRDPGKNGPLFDFKPGEHPVIIFSDHHKGARNGSDDFAPAEKNYLAALDYYNNRRFYYINLGDSEELWENTIFQVLNHNKDTFDKEKLFVDRNAFVKIVGNHDLYWGNDPFAGVSLKYMYGKAIKIYTGAVLRTELPTGYIDFFCTHGHQGDAQSDGNAFSKWFVSMIWGPLQSYLQINTNSPSCNDDSKTLHNQFMYEWSAKQNDLILITGHTHQPVFKSLTHLERLYLNMEEAIRDKNQEAIDRITKEIPKRKKEYDYVNSSFRTMKPGYFNAGCCCFDGGTITGLEIADGYIRLVRWVDENGTTVRKIAEEYSLLKLSADLSEHSPNAF
jgi:predicted phosphodiesterase